MPNTREKLIELMEQEYYCSIEEMADHLIANGVTIPVRCKDCKHCYSFITKRNKQPMCRCMRHDLDVIVRTHDFCSYGERRDDNGKV